MANNAELPLSPNMAVTDEGVRLRLEEYIKTHPRIPTLQDMLDLEGAILKRNINGIPYFYKGQFEFIKNNIKKYEGFYNTVRAEVQKKAQEKAQEEAQAAAARQKAYRNAQNAKNAQNAQNERNAKAAVSAARETKRKGIFFNPFTSERGLGIGVNARREQQKIAQLARIRAERAERAAQPIPQNGGKTRTKRRKSKNKAKKSRRRH
jgi:hypothetical protein